MELREKKEWFNPKNLPNNCRRSKFNVFPSNWDESRPKMRTKWRIEYRFYDDRYAELHPTGFQKVLKQGINPKKTPEERQAIVEYILRMEENLLEKGYNPIENKLELQKAKELKEKSDSSIQLPPASHGNDDDIAAISPLAGLEDALRFGVKARDISKNTKTDIRKIIPPVVFAASQLYYNKEKDIIATKKISEDDPTLNQLPIKDFTTRHIRVIVDRVAACRAKPGEEWTPNMYNRYLAYLSMCFIGLIGAGIITDNPTKNIPRKTVQKDDKPRPTMSNEKSLDVVETLLENPETYAFGRFVKIFRSSGGRETEFARLQGKDISLEKETFNLLDIKGRNKRKKVKIIKMAPDTIDLWKELIKECKTSNDFVFAKGLRPGPVPINPVAYGRRWKKTVKKGMGVNEDMYSEKHRDLTHSIDQEIIRLAEVIKKKAQEKAAEKAGHESTEMVQGVYDIRNDIRIPETVQLLREVLKEL